MFIVIFPYIDSTSNTFNICMITADVLLYCIGNKLSWTLTDYIVNICDQHCENCVNSQFSQCWSHIFTV